ncbi:helix-turn-helix transcriptional regulator [Streptomyces sp. 5-6(2022)]|uniref:helix-turn-helix domain-containing protein n=1 Tax=Streptomyces sp. 5-6(2022) TaxID=2936510 RepID=UPI0023B9C90B|nr:helix-turn-helix transcriptional regulator [Streptomyces sp. 5-6(2022)]
MTTARTEAPHGERRCYLRGCRRPECCKANYQYMTHLRLDTIRGNNRRTPATQSRAHIQQLIALGWSQTQIGDTTRVSRRTISEILDGRRTVSNATALAILSTPIGPPPPPRDTDATGTVRRIRALVAIGWPLAQIAPHVGMHVTALGHIARGNHDTVRVATAEAVAAEYRRLSRIPGPSTRARNHAVNQGWHGPLAWDDIDNPEAQPELEADADHKPDQTETARHISSEIQHLAAFNIPEHEIAKRVGRSKSYVHEQLAGRRGPGWRQQLDTAA